jgi:hypothetical protein
VLRAPPAWTNQRNRIKEICSSGFMPLSFPPSSVPQSDNQRKSGRSPVPSALRPSNICFPFNLLHFLLDMHYALVVICASFSWHALSRVTFYAAPQASPSNSFTATSPPNPLRPTKSFRIRTYKQIPRFALFWPKLSFRKPFRIRTSANSVCNPFTIRTSEKRWGGGGDHSLPTAPSAERLGHEVASIAGETLRATGAKDACCRGG